jgi:two-component system phosphate regulon sensor histidine kinase PhoR
MRTNFAKNIALTVSLVAAGVILFVYILLQNSQLNLSGWLALAFAVAMFLLMYFMVLRLINRFVFRKINPIYKTIQNLKIPDDELRKQLEGKDLISEVNRDVQDWAMSKSLEINKLKELEDYRKEFLGNVSHELKTPIFNVQGYVLTLLDGALEDSTINRQYLERTEKSVNRLISIVEDLETISKLESNVIQLNHEKVNLVTLVEEVFDAQEIRARKKRVKLTFDQQYSEPIWAYADKKKLFQVVTNLVVNSISYGKDEGRTKVSFMDMGENYLVEVNDNGIGIAEQDTSRIDRKSVV